MIILNKTTIEFKEKSLNNISSEKYNNGLFRNLQDVFGKNIFLWLLPFKSHYQLEGYAFDINEEFYFSSHTKDKDEEGDYVMDTSLGKKYDK